MEIFAAIIFAIILLSAWLCGQMNIQLLFVLSAVGAWGVLLFLRRTKIEEHKQREREKEQALAAKDQERAFLEVIHEKSLVYFVFDTCTWMNLFDIDEMFYDSKDYSLMDYLNIGIEKKAVRFVLVSNVFDELDCLAHPSGDDTDDGKRGKLARDARKFIDSLCQEGLVDHYKSFRRGPADDVIGEVIKKKNASRGTYIFISDDAGARIQISKARNEVENSDDFVIGIMSTADFLGKITQCVNSQIDGDI